MLKSAFSRALVAVFVILSFVGQGTLVLAGTTGALTGTVSDSTTKQPLVGAKVTATSPSQIATATTDAKGHFELLSLAPDTYTVTITFAGYDPSSVTGVTVFADNSRDIAIPADKITKTIAVVKSKPASSLVKAGTTADVYSVDSASQAKVAVAGGGTNLDSAFSALATVPGVSVVPGQSGYIGAGPTLSIRGGDYDQIGYEIDGVPVNRAFDNYPSGPTSSLGQQELQVYTGAPPADSQSDGISGYINQVIKTGTSPGFESVTGSIGGPAYYHKVASAGTTSSIASPINSTVRITTTPSVRRSAFAVSIRRTRRRSRRRATRRAAPRTRSKAARWYSAPSTSTARAKSWIATTSSTFTTTSRTKTVRATICKRCTKST
jgi:hypothetical protein